MRKTGLFLIFLGFFYSETALFGQVPFARKGQVFQLLDITNQLVDVNVTAGSNVLNLESPASLPANGFNALGFRKQDNFLYAISIADNHLYRIGQNGSWADMGSVGLDNSLYYLAGDVSPDGKHLVCIGSNATGDDTHIAFIDLESTAAPTSFVSLAAGGKLMDITFDPSTGVLYGYDANLRKLVIVNPATGNINASFVTSHYENQLYTLFFDPFGDLYAYGSAVGGIVDGIFLMDKNTGKEKRLATGPKEFVADAASCPYSVAVKARVEPEIILPCSEFECLFTFANGTGETRNGLQFEYVLPVGFQFLGIVFNQTGGVVDASTTPGVIKIDQLHLLPGNHELALRFTTNDLPKGPYKSQASIRELTPLYGDFAISDNSRTAGFRDSTVLVINRFDEDSLRYQWLICHGQTLEIDATLFGSDIQWNNGSTVSVLPVNTGGTYSLFAGNTCESVVVSHEVVSTNCPFTIEVDHEVLPKDTVFPCSNALFRFILRNDSGESRSGLIFTDTLPAGFSVVNVAKNTTNGTFQTGLAPHIITFNGVLLRNGADTIDITVNIGDQPSGYRRNRAYLRNIPALMGPFRMSDNPLTSDFDSTALFIRNAGFDSLFQTQSICQHSSLELDGSGFGETFEWDNGATTPKRRVESAGNYYLKVLDGCAPSYIFWEVVNAGAVEVLPLEVPPIHQGETIALAPDYLVAMSDSLFFSWTDPFVHSINCPNCAVVQASPLRDVTYTFTLSNGACSDSIAVLVKVDKTRRVYTGNIFTPNDDNDNDYFFLQSPDAAIIHAFHIADRWGNQVYQSIKPEFNQPYRGWNGTFRDKPVPEGIYLWWAEIEFPDGEIVIFKGDVGVVR